MNDKFFYVMEGYLKAIDNIMGSENYESYERLTANMVSDAIVLAGNEILGVEHKSVCDVLNEYKNGDYDDIEPCFKTYFDFIENDNKIDSLLCWQFFGEIEEYKINTSRLYDIYEEFKDVINDLKQQRSSNALDENSETTIPENHQEQTTIDDFIDDSDSGDDFNMFNNVD